MKVRCHNCNSVIEVKPFERLRSTQCSECHRLVFKDERIWGTVWILFTILCAAAVCVLMFRLTKESYKGWSAYLPLICPAFVLAILSPIGNFVVFLAHKLKDKSP